MQEGLVYDKEAADEFEWAHTRLEMLGIVGCAPESSTKALCDLLLCMQDCVMVETNESVCLWMDHHNIVYLKID